jgi:concentrative nucleoside transporter, CNT family
MQQFQGLIGLFVLVGLAWVISTNRARFPLRFVLAGVGLQLVMALLLLGFEPIVRAFDVFARGVNAVIQSADAGSAFLFGDLASPGGPAGFVFAFRVLPVIVFFAALMGVLYHIGFMQMVIGAFAWVLRRTLRVTGAESLAMAANVFVGQTEAPLCVGPYVSTMRRSELATLMVGGFATIAGSVLVAFVGMLGGDDPVARQEFIKHLLTASLLSAPAAFVIARVIIPAETDIPAQDVHQIKLDKQGNILEAAAAGATDGLRLALNVAAMLVAFVALLALVNVLLGAVGGLWGMPDLSLEVMMGWILAPLAWAIGVPWDDASFFGMLLGKKLVVTEFLAYDALSRDIASATPTLSPRSVVIATYALCGFANFASIGIQIGGLSSLAPERRGEIAGLALRMMLGGALASWMTASIASLFIPA